MRCRISVKFKKLKYSNIPTSAMIIKLKWVIIAQAIFIVILLAVVLNFYLGDSRNSNLKQYNNNNGLLSSRIYSGLLEPKSLLIVNFNPLKKEILDYITGRNINVSVYVENLRNGAFLGINEKTGFFPASLNKLPVAILIMQKIEAGDLSLDTMVEIKDIDKTDSSGDLYKTKEKRLPLKFVLEKMLKESDNTALRVLLRYVNLDDLQFILDYYGLDISIRSEENKELVSPKAISAMFMSLYFSTVLEPKNSEYLLSLLADSTFDINQIAGLPDDVRVAHKFGENYNGDNKFFHDCGILYIDEKRLFYCVMSKNLDEEDSVQTIGFIVNKIYTYVEQTDVMLNNYKKKG